MANKRVSSGRSGRRSSAGRKASIATQAEQLLDKTGIDLRKLNGRGGYKRSLRSLAPVLGTVVGGVGAYFGVRFLIRYYKENPEMLSFIRDNFDSIESRLREFRGGESQVDQDETEARH